MSKTATRGNGRRRAAPIAKCLLTIWYAPFGYLAPHGVHDAVDHWPRVQVGLACHQTREKWAHEIKTAQAAGIDGFALNIGPSDHWTETQLEFAYREAEQTPGFSLFISFE
jgi:hypothetical protein